MREGKCRPDQVKVRFLYRYLLYRSTDVSFRKLEKQTGLQECSFFFKLSLHAPGVLRLHFGEVAMQSLLTLLSPATM